jgi:hypothetical protein
MKLTGENRSTRRKICPPQIPHGQIRDRTLGLRGERPATNRLSHDTACPELSRKGSDKHMISKYSFIRNLSLAEYKQTSCVVTVI